MDAEYWGKLPSMSNEEAKEVLIDVLAKTQVLVPANAFYERITFLQQKELAERLDKYTKEIRLLTYVVALGTIVLMILEVYHLLVPK
jgi:hypothetical protein